jgi:hypothetical protein
MFPVLPAIERPSLDDAWFSRGSRDGSHPAQSTVFYFPALCLVCFFFFLLCFCSSLVFGSDCSLVEAF